MTTSIAEGRGAGRLMSWIGVVSAVVTILLTVLNAYWSNQVRLIEADIKEREIQIEADKGRLSRYAFVQDMLDGVLDRDASQRALTVNLITLALTDEEAEQLFGGLESSENEVAQDIGRVGLSTIRVSELVGRMNAAVRQSRIDAVETLITDYKDDPAAVDQALSLLEPPKIGDLSASGRINVLVFLRNTSPGAWSQRQAERARTALTAMRDRDARGEAAIGPQTNEAMRKLLVHLDEVSAAF